MVCYCITNKGGLSIKQGSKDKNINTAASIYGLHILNLLLSLALFVRCLGRFHQSTLTGSWKLKDSWAQRAVRFEGKPLHCFLLVLHIAIAYSMPMLALQMAVSSASGDMHTISRKMARKCDWQVLERNFCCWGGRSWEQTGVASVATSIPLLSSLRYHWVD